MGNKATREATGMKTQQEGDIHDLPEGCIAHIISRTSARDACASALVSKAFNVVADSDFVWGRLLPPDYIDILSRSVSTKKMADFSSKKELFLYLCSNTIFLDGGTKCVNVEKMTGKKCATLGAKMLEISWCGTPQYWKWGAHSGSRFAEVAELIDFCRLEMTMKIDSQMLSTKTTYGVDIVLNHGDGAYQVEEPPITFWATFVGGGGAIKGLRSDYLEDSRGQRCRYRRHSDIRNPTMKVDACPSQGGECWIEIEIGEFYNDEAQDGELQVFLQNDGFWKHPLIVESIQFRPKSAMIV